MINDSPDDKGDEKRRRIIIMPQGTESYWPVQQEKP